MKRFILMLLVLAALSAWSQTTVKDDKTSTTEKKTTMFGITFSGYIKTDIFYDTRQMVGLREGQFLLYPENKKPDADGKDINAKDNFNMVSIQTRLAISVTGPDVLGAKTSGYIEGEFFGNVNPAINTFRLRHAFVKLAWPKTELLVGQYWHPMFVASCAPETVSFNTGAPFVVFSRNPQVRLSQNLGKFKVQLTALTQLDFTSTGPDGPSPKYLRNAVLPEMNLLVQYSTRNETKGTEFIIGATVDYLVLIPLLSTDIVVKKAYDTVINNIVFHNNAVTNTYKANTTIGSLGASIFTKLKLKPITMKLGGAFGGNNYSWTMLGGYVVKNVTDPSRGSVDYANVSTFAGWGEVMTNGTKWQFGLFGAYEKNLGAGVPVTGPYYSRGNNIDYLYRISPRALVNINKFRVALELEYTGAGYGSTNEKGFVYDVQEVGNLRALLGVYYFF